MDAMRGHRDGGLVLASYSDARDAEAAVRALVDAGFGTDDVSIIARDEDRAQRVADHTGADVGKGAGIGALTGGVLGALGGLLVGATALTIPGVGIILAGPLAAVLGGAGLGAVGGGLVGALTAAGVSEGEARHYEGRLKAGDIVVAVAAGDREAMARDILRGGMAGYASPGSAGDTYR